MSRRCELSGVNRQIGHKVSHSNIKSKTVQQPNLQRVRAKVNGSPMRLRVCTRCLRSGCVEKSL